MKRLLAALSVLVAATLTITALAAGQSAPVKAATKQVTSSVTPRRDRSLPYTFTTTGRIIPPGSCAAGVPGTVGGTCVPRACPVGTTNPSYCQPVPTSLLCRGRVTVTTKKGVITMSKRNVPVSSRCTYRSRVSYRTPSPKRRGNFTVVARFLGNTYLLPRNASKKTVRAG